MRSLTAQVRLRDQVLQGRTAVALDGVGFDLDSGLGSLLEILRRWWRVVHDVLLGGGADKGLVAEFVLLFFDFCSLWMLLFRILLRK